MSTALTTAEQARPTVLARAYNRVVDTARRITGEPPPLRFEQALARAERAAGHRLVDNARTAFFREAFNNGLEAVGAPDQLSPFGRLVLRKTTQRNLVNLIRLEALAAAEPAAFAAPMPPPVAIVGHYRSGTTLLHKLLAQHPALRAPRTWELFLPVPRTPRSRLSDALRRLRVRADVAGSSLAVPAMDDVHRLEVDGYEESLFLLETAGVMFTAWYALGGYAHGEWLTRQDLTPAYRSLEMQLRTIGWGQDMHGAASGDRRWLIKCPLTTWFLDPLFEVFPEAPIVQLHRPLAQTLPSFCSMLEVLQRGGMRTQRPEAIGGWFGDFFIEGARRAAAARARRPHARVLDVDYAELVAEPEGVTARIIEWLGLPPAPSPSTTRAAQGGRFRSRHVYDAELFGLDLPALEARLAEVMTGASTA